MNERRQDFELLQAFARHRDESAFATLVERHLTLVHGTARRLPRSPPRSPGLQPVPLHRL